MEQHRFPEARIELTLGPGGYILSAHPALRSILQLPENEKVNFPALYASIQPKNIFLSLCNTEGTGVFTISGKLFEIVSKKSNQGQETILSFQQIGDDTEEIQPNAELKPLTQARNSSIKPFDLIKIFDLVFEKISTAQTCAYYLLEPETKALFPQFARGFQDDNRIKKIVLSENKRFYQAIQESRPLLLNRLNFFEDYVLDPASIFEYRYATGGKLPLSALLLPLPAENAIRSVLILENYDCVDAFSEDGLPELIAAITQISTAEENPTESNQKEFDIHLQAIDSIYTFIDSIEPNADLIGSLNQQLSFLIPFDRTAYFPASSANATTDLTQRSENGERAAIRITPAQDHLFKPNTPVLIGENNSAVFQSYILDQQLSNLLLPIYRDGSLAGVYCLAKKEENFFTSAHINTATLFLKFLRDKLSSKDRFLPSSEQRDETEMIHQNEKRLSQNNAVWEAIFDGILVTDSINRIQFTNNALSKYLNMPLTQMAEPNIDTVNTFFKTTLSSWKEKILDWSINPDAINPGESYSEQVKLQSGRVLSIHLTPVMWKKEFLGTVSIFRDVSYEFEFDRLKTDFITSISHELRTPLTSIQGYVDLLLMGVAGHLSDEQRGFMAIVKSNSERLNNLINDMLELTTIEAGKVNLTIHPTDIFELAQDVLARFRIRSEKENKAIEFYLETDSSIPLVLADPERAKQILENLVNNAYTFTETEGKITISLKNYQDGLQVNISDTGIGITKEQKEQIFDHFSWADNPSPQTLQGVGLGLPIVKQLVELQNGRIWVESSGIPGEGSTFSFTLPSQVS